MKIQKAYKFRLKPDAVQEQQLNSFAGHCRFLWNKVLSLNLERLNNKQSLIWYHEANFWLTFWKKSDDYGFLKEAPAQCLQQKLKDLNRAFQDAFDKNQPGKKMPIYKKRENKNSFRFPEPKHIQLDNRRIKFPKLGWMGFYKSEKIHGELRNVTVSKESDHWYMSIQVEMDVPDPVHPAHSAIGIDVGIKKFAAISDGSISDPIHVFRVWEKRLGKAQKRLAKKVKFSENWKKQKKRIRKIHRKIANIRRDFLHKLSTQLCKSHALIVVEKLKITNMSKSAKGTLEQPGKNVNAKSGLNKSILDQGWGEFRRQLEYKLNWLGGIFQKVNPRYTSQTCNVCKHIDPLNRQSQERFECQCCGYTANADINAAKNILAAGLAVLACGEAALAASMKQEPLGMGDLVPA